MSQLRNILGKKITKKIKQGQMKGINLFKLKKTILKKDMKAGSNLILKTILCFALFSNFLYAEEKISSTTLLNLNELKPSFEEIDETKESSNYKQSLKNKKKTFKNKKNSHAVLIGLDKITAKSSKIIVNLNEPRKFGQLEIKVLKCGKVLSNNRINDVAYLQVKDLTKEDNDKVFDHAIYDIQLLNCYNV